MTYLKVCARIAAALATLFTALTALAGAVGHPISQIFEPPGYYEDMAAGWPPASRCIPSS